MKRFFCFLVFCFLCVPVFSQKGELIVKSGTYFSLDLADSLLYVLPDYSMGIVMFKDGTRAQALLNINTLEQCVCFIDDHGDTLHVSNENEIDAVYVSGRFFKKQVLYLEVLNQRADVSVALVRKMVLDRPQKEGAYGSKAETSSIESISQLGTNSGSIEILERNLNVPWRYSFIVYLYDGRKIFPSSKKSFLKLFPAKSEMISDYLRNHDVDFRKMEDVQALLDLCL